MSREFEALGDAADPGMPTVLYTYGATNPAPSWRFYIKKRHVLSEADIFRFDSKENGPSNIAMRLGQLPQTARTCITRS